MQESKTKKKNSFSSKKRNSRNSNSQQGSFRGKGRPSRSRNRRGPKPTMDIEAFMAKRNNEKPQKPYTTLNTFNEFQLDQSLERNIAKAGYVTPTEIQDKGIPQMLQGKDVIGIAGTGTGKTAAFLIPIIQELIEEPLNNSALIIAPTRELANQIGDEFVKLTRGMRFFSTTLIGGGSVSQSIRSLSRTNHIIIGTPGRLIDMVDRGKLKLAEFKTLVLDEFDRMLDMGFSDDVKYLVSKMRTKQQTLLFSATMDKSQKKIVSDMTKNPIEIYASSGTHASKAVDQSVVKVKAGETKLDVIKGLVNQRKGERMILFCETKRRVNDLNKKLSKSGISSDLIHGDKTQRARENALKNLKKGKVDILIATDVLARGIDVTDVSLVINYEVPKTYNDYVHRIGRTGRAGKTGQAITLVG